MNIPIRLLIIDDSQEDAFLLSRELLRGGFTVTFERVWSEEQMQKALASASWDIIVSDQTIPTFSGLEALSLYKRSGLDIPFIIVSGTIGEERAVEAMKAGASDCVMKHNLKRIVPVFERELREAEERRHHKRVEQALATAEGQFKSLVENSIVGIYVIQDRKFAYVNPRMADILGYSVTEVINHPVIEFIHPEDRELVEENVRKRLQGLAQSIHYELRMLRKDATVAEVEVHGTRSEYQGHPSILGILLDVTKRSEQERALQNSEQRYRLLLESTNEGIYGIDQEGRCTFLNQAAVKMLGFSLEELLGRELHEVIHHSRQDGGPYPIEECPIYLAVQNGSSCRITDEVFWRKDGTSFPVEYCASPIIDRGMVQGAVVAFADCAEKKRLEEQFLRNQRMESIGTLAGGVAHDLNNVLAPILMGLQILRMRVSDPEVLTLVDTLENSAQRGAGIVKQILSFARGVESERGDVQLRHLILEQAKICKDTFPVSIQIHTKVAKELWPVMGDATQLHQVMMNFCVNARDAMPGGGNLTLRAENFLVDDHYAKMHMEAKKGPYVVLTVSDTGTGIPSHIIDKIFDPFFTTKPVGKGTGLGLSTVLGIIKGHGGWVNVYSERGRGAQFKVFLPALNAAAGNVSTPEIISAALGSGELVLVVDDEQTIRQVTKQTLEANGYQVLTASDGTEALAGFAQRRKEIALVITDMAMPFLDGPATIRALKKLQPALKIIAVSGMLDNGRVVDVADTPGVTFLSKPFTAETLLNHMAHVLKSDAPV